MMRRKDTCKAKEKNIELGRDLGGKNLGVSLRSTTSSHTTLDKPLALCLSVLIYDMRYLLNMVVTRIYNELGDTKHILK